MICGEKPGFSEFPYRASSHLTAFFTGLDFDYIHRGETRLDWVRRAVLEINQESSDEGDELSPSVVRLIEELLNPTYFTDTIEANREAAIERVRTLLQQYRYDVFVDGSTRVALVRPAEAKPNTLRQGFNVSKSEIGRTHSAVAPAVVECPQELIMSVIPRRIFVSHATNDKELIATLVRFLLNILVVRDRREILCTSLPGHELAPGVDPNDYILNAIKEAGVVIGVLTPESLQRQAVMMELGAAWALGKKFFPVLYDVGFDKIPTWLNRQAINLRESHTEFSVLNRRMLALAEEIARHTDIPLKGGADLGDAVHELFSALSRFSATSRSSQ